MSPPTAAKRPLEAEANPYSAIQPAKRRRTNSPDSRSSPARAQKRSTTARKDLDRSERDAYRQRLREADARREAERERERMQRRDGPQALNRGPPPTGPAHPDQKGGQPGYPSTHGPAPPPPLSGGGGGGGEVREYYNNMQRFSKQYRDRHSEIKDLRKFNNWVKSILINKATSQEPSWSKPVIHPPTPDMFLKVLDIGCGQGGDLHKWQMASTPLSRYVGLDIAEDSIQEAQKRYSEMAARSAHHKNPPLFDAHFFARDAFAPGTHLGDIRPIYEIGIEREVKYNSDKHARSGFDIVSMMFCLHYAFESEAQAAQAIKTVSCALKIGGKFIGTIPSSDEIVERKIRWHKEVEKERKAKEEFDKSGRKAADVEEGEDLGFSSKGIIKGEEDELGKDKAKTLKWGNSVYEIAFQTPTDGTERFDAGILTEGLGPFGVKYDFHLKEAVDVPEYVVPFGVLRQMCEDNNLRLVMDESFGEVWKKMGERREGEFAELAERMGVRGRDGSRTINREQFEACCFYRAFMFVKL